MEIAAIALKQRKPPRRAGMETSLRPAMSWIFQTRRRWTCLPPAGLVAFVILLSSSPGRSQAFATGTIEGAVTDSSGGVVPSASIEITQSETNTTSRIQTDKGGRYFVPNLRVGPYQVTASKEGFKTE